MCSEKKRGFKRSSRECRVGGFAIGVEIKEFPVAGQVKLDVNVRGTVREREGSEGGL